MKNYEVIPARISKGDPLNILENSLKESRERSLKEFSMNHRTPGEIGRNLERSVGKISGGIP